MTPSQARISEWRASPAQFVHQCFGVEPDAWQLDALNAFPHHNRLAMKAAKGVGKSTILAWCIWNFIATRPHPKIAVTSISADNLSDGLWSELSKWQQRSDFLKNMFTWTKTRVSANDAPETWWISARTWAKAADKSQQANTLAGLHADYLLFVLDEAGGIPDAVMAAAEAGLSTGKETKIMMAGNPTHLEGPLYRACTLERHLWWVAEITADPNDPKRSPRVDINWAKQQIDKYGADNPWVLVNVFGRFPPASINTLLGPDDVTQAMARGYQEDKYNFAQKRLGIDVARFGDDRTIIFPRQGLRAFKPTEMRGARSNEIAARIIKGKAKWESEVEFIDDSGGYGSGVIDFMLQSGHAPYPVNFAGKALDSRYHNIRAEMWFKMAEWVKRGGMLPKVPELVRELTVPTYTFTSSGKFLIEPKDQIKERLQFSPDLADALCLTFALPEMPAKDSLPGMVSSQKKIVSDWDPFSAQ